MLDAALRLLHPVMPFLTEELWHKLPQPAGARSIALDHFPEARKEWIDAAADADMALIQEIIAAARNIRAEMKIDQKKKVAAEFSSKEADVRALVERKPRGLDAVGFPFGVATSRPEALAAEGAAVRSTAQFDLRIAYGDVVDKPAEIAKMQKEIERLAKDIETKKARLADETFTSKAPAKVVD